MARFRDRYGYELSTSSAAAAGAYVQAVDHALAGTGDLEVALEAALAADPGFALAQVAAARNYQFLGRAAEAREASERALALAPGTSRREQQHVACVARSIGGDGPGCLALLREHVGEFPRDAYVLSMATGPFGLIGFGGGPDWRVEGFELLEPLADVYGEDWWFDSAMAFAHNELYHFSEARRLAERSLAACPGSGHGSHTLAHVQFETGAFEEGARFLRDWLPGYERKGALYGHNSWHLALFEILRGHPGAALVLWEDTIAPAAYPSRPVIGVCDASSLMWRFDLYGLRRPEGSREAVAAHAAASFPRPGVTFADVHCALAYAAACDWTALDGLRSGLADRLAAGRLPAGPVTVALVDAVTAFAKEDYGAAVDRLLPFYDEVVRIGGSNAQREVFEDTLIEAALRSNRIETAADLLRERLARRPSARDERLVARAQALVKAEPDGSVALQ